MLRNIAKDHKSQTFYLMMALYISRNMTPNRFSLLKTFQLRFGFFCAPISDPQLKVPNKNEFFMGNCDSETIKKIYITSLLQITLPDNRMSSQILKPSECNNNNNNNNNNKARN